MGRFIVLCDHDLCWDTNLKKELDNKKLNDENISIGYADGIDDIESIFPNIHIDIIICSVMEFNSFIQYEGLDGLHKYTVKKNVSIFVIADEYSETDELTALNLGCFDYQLRSAPIKVVAQRIKNRLAETGHGKKLYFDSDTDNIYSDRELIRLTKHEHAVLKLLLLHEGSIVEKDVIIQKVWGDDFTGNTRVIDTVVKQLRKKLANYNVTIVTHYGRGVSISLK